MMNREKQKLIEELASKMAVNDLMYDYRVRAITEFADSLEKLFAIPVVIESVCSMKGKGFCPHELNKGKCNYEYSCKNKQTVL